MNKRLDELEKMGKRKGAEEKVKRSFLSYFKKNEGNVPFREQLEKLYDWLTTKKMTTRDKAILIGALLYFINPLDAVPDITPLLGFLDDAGVIALAYRYFQNRALEEFED